MKISEGIDVSILHGDRPHKTLQRFRRHLEARRRAAGLKGENGRYLCLWCLSEVPPRCSSWCSRDCSETFFVLTDWNTMRRRVLERDRGICAECGVDTIADAEAFRAMYAEEAKANTGRDWYGFSTWQLYRCPKALEYLRERKIGENRAFGDWWDADHIIPLAEGGANGVDNLRTLCVDCHKKHTKALAKRLADGRRNRIPLLDDGAA